MNAYGLLVTYRYPICFSSSSVQIPPFHLFDDEEELEVDSAAVAMPRITGSSRRNGSSGTSSKTRFVSVVFCSGAVIVCIMLAAVRDSISSTGLPKDLDSSLLSVFDGATSSTVGTRELQDGKTGTDSNSATIESAPSIRSSESSSSTKQSSNGKSATNNDWKLWHEMTKEEQDASTLRLKPYVEKYGQLYMKGHQEGRKIHKHGRCDLVTLKDKTSAGHGLCGPPPPKPCNFFSFGINDDPSFDVTLAEQWGCRGFAADPTVDHPSKLHPLGKVSKVPNARGLAQRCSDFFLSFPFHGTNAMQLLTITAKS